MLNPLVVEAARRRTTRWHKLGLGRLPARVWDQRKSTCRYNIWLVMGGAHKWWASTLFQVFILGLIVTNVALVVIDTDPFYDTQAGTPFNDFYIFFELGSVIIFAIEYLLRLWCCVEAPAQQQHVAQSMCIKRFRWATKPLALVDLFALVPFITDLVLSKDNHYRGATMLRLMRTFSLLRMERSFKSFARIAAVLSRKTEELFITTFMAVILLTLSSSIMYYVENPDGANNGANLGAHEDLRGRQSYHLLTHRLTD